MRLQQIEAMVESPSGTWMASLSPALFGRFLAKSLLLRQDPEKRFARQIVYGTVDGHLRSHLDPSLILRSNTDDSDLPFEKGKELARRHVDEQHLLLIRRIAR